MGALHTFRRLALVGACLFAASLAVSIETRAAGPSWGPRAEQPDPLPKPLPASPALTDVRAQTPGVNGGPATRKPAPLPGDTVDDPIWLTGYLPFQVTGNTCGFEDDYDEVCPYQNSTAPDVVYAYQPVYDEIVYIDLCESGYDTKVYVYENEVNPGYPIACNDDACGVDGYRSRLEYVSLHGGYVYYIVVDGYASDCGDYTLTMTYTWECVWCSDQGIHEGEPDCHTNYEDLYNSGCNADPPRFQSLEPSDEEWIEVCGKSGTFVYNGMNYRDTDWYQLDLPGPRTISVTSWANFALQILLLDGRQGCDSVEILNLDMGSTCVTLEMTSALDPGVYWLWVGPRYNVGVPCGSEYQVFIEGYTPGPSGTDGPTIGCEAAPCLVVEPNPFVRETTIGFVLRSPGPVTLELFDPSGRLLDRPLDDEWLEAGSHRVLYSLAGSGRDGTGARLWFCRLRTADGTWTRRAVRLD